MGNQSTSIQAQARISNYAGLVRDLVFDAIKAFGKDGLTAHECAAVLDIDKATVQPRTSELHSDSLIVDSGMRRPNASGRNAIVWVVA